MALISASNFEARKINMRVPFKNSIMSGYTIIEGYGIWDISANAWVCAESVCHLSGSKIPTTYKKKSTALFFFSGGLHNEHYTLI